MEFQKNRFVIHGKEERLISGAVHYFRTHPDGWEDILLKLKALGANTVETYVPWNLHEKKQGEYCFTGMLDLARFLQTAQKLGLWALVRPGPYICAEWSYGGFPAWLNTLKGLRLRCYNEPYLKALEPYLRKVYEIIEPLQYHKKGNVLMVQIENEYGAFGNDQKYLKWLEKLAKEYLEIPFFTSDQPEPHMLEDGSFEGALMTANFGSRAQERFPLLREKQKEKPLMCMEYWCGWFDHWQGYHHERSGKTAANSLEEILQMEGSVNFYMFHGGTNFAFYNGANCKEPKKFEPTITSYDYDALLKEDGSLTLKYLECQKVIQKYHPSLEEIKVKDPFKITGTAFYKNSYALLENISHLSSCHEAAYPLTIDETGEDAAFILYETTVCRPSGEAKGEFLEVCDRALIFVDGKWIKTIYRNDEHYKFTFAYNGQPQKLQILVENMGRINYGPFMGEQKGLPQGVLLEGKYHFSWKSYPLVLENLSLKNLEKTKGRVCFYEYELDIKEIGNTYLYTEPLGKGMCFVNGFNIGRYWSEGPQFSLFIPQALLKKGKNTLVLLELEKDLSSYRELKCVPSCVWKKKNKLVKMIMNKLLSKI